MYNSIYNHLKGLLYMDEKINYDILNTIGIILSIVSAILSLSIYFTDTFWYIPGVCTVSYTHLRAHET